MVGALHDVEVVHLEGRDGRDVDAVPGGRDQGDVTSVNVTSGDVTRA